MGIHRAAAGEVLRRFWVLLVVASVCAATSAHAAPQIAGLDELKAHQAKSVAQADRLVAATVAVMPEAGPNSRGRMGMGSGVIVSEDGLILTAAHVSRAIGKHATVLLSDGRRVKAETLGSVNNADAGMMRITEAGDYPHVELGDSGALKVADWCLAIGHPGGYQADRTAPMRLGRVLFSGDGATMVTGIRTDAAVISGDSGGPLFDLDGRLIGIHSNIGPSQSMNHHVPISVYKKHWDDMLAGKQIGKAPKTPHGPEAAKMMQKLGKFQRMLRQRLEAQDPEVMKMIRESGGQLQLDPAKIARLVDRWEKEDAGEVDAEDADPDEAADDDKPAKGVEGDAGAQAEGDSEPKVVTRFGPPRSRYTRAQVDDLQRVFTTVGELTGRGAAFTVRIDCDGEPSVLGTIVDPRGYIVTKASELRGELTVHVGDRAFAGEVVAQRKPDDLALVKIDAAGLVAAKLVEATPVRGTWVACPDETGKPMAAGMVSINTRKIPHAPQGLMANTNRAALGIGLGAGGDGRGAAIGRVFPKSAAARAGLKAGDVITAVNGEATPSGKALVESLSDYAPGDKVTVTYTRKGAEAETRVKLQSIEKLPARSNPMLDALSGGDDVLSRRRRNFPAAFTHDAILTASQCGGPVLDLDGRVVAINIARVDRTASYAIPASHVLPLLEKMMPQ